MNDDDREAVQRQMTIRVVHLKLLQQRLDRLPDAPAGSHVDRNAYGGRKVLSFL